VRPWPSCWISTVKISKEGRLACRSWLVVFFSCCQRVSFGTIWTYTSLYGRWTYIEIRIVPPLTNRYEKLHRSCVWSALNFSRGGAPEEKCSPTWFEKKTVKIYKEKQVGWLTQSHSTVITWLSHTNGIGLCTCRSFRNVEWFILLMWCQKKSLCLS
jgi:hypothetical protein